MKHDRLTHDELLIPGRAYAPGYEPSPILAQAAGAAEPLFHARDLLHFGSATLLLLGVVAVTGLLIA